MLLMRVFARLLLRYLILSISRQLAHSAEFPIFERN